MITGKVRAAALGETQLVGFEKSSGGSLPIACHFTLSTACQKSV
jgi:hypothetical protein